MDKHNKRKDDYQRLQNQLDQTKEEQISTSIHESGHMVLRSNITEVTYNVQSTVDAQHCIPIDYELTNRNDPEAMGGWSEEQRPSWEAPILPYSLIKANIKGLNWKLRKS